MSMLRYNEEEIEDSIEFCRDIELYYKENYACSRGRREYEIIKHRMKYGIYFYDSNDVSCVPSSRGQELEEKLDGGSFKRVVIYNFIELVICIGIAMFLGHMLTTYIGVYTKVDGISMEHTLQDSDYLIIEKISYQFHDPKRFDIIVFPYEENVYYIKRIIGLPGERIEIKENHIYINGERLEEDYGKEAILHGGIIDHCVMTLGKEEYFVMGDNRNHSVDSRYVEIGGIKREEIIGRAWVRLYPLDRMGFLEHK